MTKEKSKPKPKQTMTELISQDLFQAMVHVHNSHVAGRAPCTSDVKERRRLKKDFHRQSWTKKKLNQPPPKP